MGNQKQKWTPDEEKALLAGIDKYGTGKWKNILQDSQFSPFLTHRSNIDLKDKWRNMSVSASGLGSRERSRGSLKKNNNANAENSAPNVPLLCDASSSAVVADDDPPKNPLEESNYKRYTGMIFEALSTVNDPDGSDTAAILSYIERKEELPLPPNFRRALGTTLRRLVLQGKLEKVQNGYKIKSETCLEPPNETPAPRKKQAKPRKSLKSAATPLQLAAENAAEKIADAENKSFIAAEAVKEAERLEEIAEEIENVIKFAEDLCAQCSKGEVFFFA